MGILSWIRPRTEVSRLQEERERLQTQLETVHLRKANQFLESSLALAGNYVGYRDPWNFHGTEKLAGKDGYIPFGQGNQQYKTGSAYPIFQNEQELQLIRDGARYLAAANPYIIGILRGLKSFVIGEGYTYTVAGKRGVNAPNDTLAKAQTHIDEFIRANVWSEMEQEIFHRSRRDGEAILRFFPADDGFVTVRTVEPEQLTQKPGESDQEWAYGVHVDADDHFETRGYWLTYDGNPANGEEVKPDEIEHIKINVDRIVRRGVSDLFCVHEVSEGAVKLLRNMQVGGAVQAAIAFIRQHQNASKAQVESFVDAHAFAKLTAAANGQPQTSRKVKWEPGTVVDINEGQEYKEPPLASKNTQNFIAIVQAALRCINTRWNAPEFMTGDASNANFSSTLVAESPFVRGCQIEQKFYGTRFVRVMERVLQAGVDAKKLPADTLEVCEVQATGPTLAVRNKMEAATENEIKRRNGVLSARTWAEQDGLDYDQEVENGAKPEAPGREAGPLPFPFRIAQ